MHESEETRWTMIRGAAAGDREARDLFGAHYLPSVRAYLAARWRGSRLQSDIDDAAQEVFVECFKKAGALERADPERGGFRGFLFGVIRNIARRFERRAARGAKREELRGSGLEQFVDDEDGPSEAFDRAWASSVMRQAGQKMLVEARGKDADALRRVELLRLRLVEDQPIRAIAAAWEMEPEKVHRAYARARREFQAALRAIVARLHSGSGDEIDAECRRLLGLFG